MKKHYKTAQSHQDLQTAIINRRRAFKRQERIKTALFYMALSLFVFLIAYIYINYLILSAEWVSWEIIRR